MVFNFILTPLIIVFAIVRSIPLWRSKKEKWSRDFQYLIHGVLLMKIVMLATNLAQVILNFEDHFKLRRYVDFVKVFHFTFDCSILMAMWYAVLFNKSVSSTSFIGPKRLPYHILSISSSIHLNLILRYVQTSKVLNC